MDESPLDAIKSMGEMTRCLAGVAHSSRLPILTFIYEMAILHCAELQQAHSAAQQAEDGNADLKRES